MPEVIIKTNGTVEGTSLSVDGKEISKKEKIIGMEMYASAPYKSQYSGETISGHVAISYDKANEDGTIERKTIVSGKDRTNTGIGQKVKSADQVIRYIDQSADAKIVDLVDKIMDHAKENELKTPDRETLLNRTYESLQDKCADLGIKLEDDIDSTKGNDEDAEDS